MSRGNVIIKTSLDNDLQIETNKILKNELINLDKKNNLIQPPLKSLNSLNFDINNWKEILQNYDNQKIISSWDLGIIAKIDNSDFYIKTKRSKKLFKLHFPYRIQPTFSVGDIVYFKIEKNSGKFIYQQVPNFDGGILILERDTNKILALDGGFSYFSTSLNMVTEKKQNLKKALYPFLNFLILDPSVFSNSSEDLQFNLNRLEKLSKKIYSNDTYKNRNLVIFNTKSINEHGLNFISKIINTSLFINDNNEILINSEMSLFDLMSFYKILLSKNYSTKTRLIENVYKNEKEVNFIGDINQINHKSNEFIENTLFKNKEIVKFLKLQSFITKNFEKKSNNKIFYGWNIYDKENGFTLFIGFNNQKIIGCYINQINPINYNDDSESLINNSCTNVVKKLF